MPLMKKAAHNPNRSVYDIPVPWVFYKTLSLRFFRSDAIRCIASIFYNFFFRQYRAALLPGRVPVSKVDHPLDSKIPFVPSWINIYLDFVAFWIRMIGFLLRRYGRRAYGEVRDFIISMGRLYAFAAESYTKNFSTTDRPFYIARPRFLFIHLVDPHLMCIPSLHVMVVILTWKKFAAILGRLNEAGNCAAQTEEMKQGALAISQAVLYVKQHSVNCISAALYAMTCFDGALFPPEEAEEFAGLLFGPLPVPPEKYCTRKNRPANYSVRPCAAPRTRLPAGDIAEIKTHVISLYRNFIAEGKSAAAAGQNWEEPLLRFMRQAVC